MSVEDKKVKQIIESSDSDSYLSDENDYLKLKSEIDLIVKNKGNEEGSDEIYDEDQNQDNNDMTINCKSYDIKNDKDNYLLQSLSIFQNNKPKTSKHLNEEITKEMQNFRQINKTDHCINQTNINNQNYFNINNQINQKNIENIYTNSLEHKGINDSNILQKQQQISEYPRSYPGINLSSLNNNNNLYNNNLFINKNNILINNNKDFPLNNISINISNNNNTFKQSNNIGAQSLTLNNNFIREQLLNASNNNLQNYINYGSNNNICMNSPQSLQCKNENILINNMYIARNSCQNLNTFTSMFLNQNNVNQGNFNYFTNKNINSNININYSDTPTYFIKGNLYENSLPNSFIPMTNYNLGSPMIFNDNTINQKDNIYQKKSKKSKFFKLNFKEDNHINSNFNENSINDIVKKTKKKKKKNKEKEKQQLILNENINFSSENINNLNSIPNYIGNILNNANIINNNSIMNNNSIINNTNIITNNNIINNNFINENIKTDKKHNEKKDKNKLNILNIISGKDKRTTLMIKNIPNKYTLNSFVKKINQNFKDAYDILYLPIDYSNKSNLGFAFINFVDSLYIINFYEIYNGKKWNQFNSDKICELLYAKFQGKKDLIAHFEKGKVLSFESEEKRPLILPTPSPPYKIEFDFKYYKIFSEIYGEFDAEITTNKENNNKYFTVDVKKLSDKLKKLKKKKKKKKLA